MPFGVSFLRFFDLLKALLNLYGAMVRWKRKIRSMLPSHGCHFLPCKEYVSFKKGNFVLIFFV
ncbi:MAG TPA: hypothetical protein DEP42_02620 [Ruminococcaceae bacterium]|nr:hypothetical protein [Oscillospiraceae bacterium]